MSDVEAICGKSASNNNRAADDFEHGEELADTQQVLEGHTADGCTIELTLLQDLVNGLRQPVYVLLSHGVGEDEPHPVTGVVTLYQQANHEA